MIDVRRLIRGVALQRLYELDIVGHERRDSIEVRSDFDLLDDVRVSGFLALRSYYLGTDKLTEARDFELKLNIPVDLRTAVEQVLIDYFTEGVPESETEAEQDLHIELTQQNAMPELEEFDLRINTPEETLSVDDQRRVQMLVNGVLDSHINLDQLLHRYAAEWPIDQVAVVDRNILRLALYEFAISKEVPLKVAINEAVELAKIFGSDSTPRFVNGVLGAVAENVRELDSLFTDSSFTDSSKEMEGA